MKVEIATSSTPALVEAVQRLTPQLSRSKPPPTADEIAEIVSSPATDLFLAIDDAGGDGGEHAGGGGVLGMATLVTFRIPTGIRAWVEDVVVDQAARNRGVGAALNRAMLDRARELGCLTVDLTSRPSREAANRLYLKLGFHPRETNVYRLDIENRD